MESVGPEAGARSQCGAQRPGRTTGVTVMTMTERKVIKAKVGLLELVTWAPSSLQSKVESWVAAMAIVTVFLCSVERRFSVPAIFVSAVARSLGQAWPQATGEAGAQRAW
jgi:hypothetical protein